MTHLATLAELGQNRRGLAMLPPVHAVYQPVVDLVSGDPVGYEALARGPRGTEWELPGTLFAEARRHGVEAALDWECRAAAISGACRRMPSSVPLFVNATAAWLDSACPPHLSGLMDQAVRRLQLVVDIAERTLAADPARVLEACARLRAAGQGIALDDVGGDLAALDLLAALEPDVIKIDLVLLAGLEPTGSRAVLDAVRKQATRTGATVLVERVESADDLARAHDLEARLGQGHRLGRPGPLPAEPPVVHHDLSFTRA